METAWDKINYNPFLGKMTKWDFSQYQPQVVIVAVAQNDNYPVKFMAENHDNPQARKWKQTYFTLLMNLRNKYPDAYIICCTTLLKHTPAWDQAISEVVAAARDERISQYLFRRNGCGTPGHLRIPEAYEMAEELTKYIQTLDIKGWETDEKNKGMTFAPFAKRGELEGNEVQKSLQTMIQNTGSNTVILAPARNSKNISFHRDQLELRTDCQR